MNGRPSSTGRGRSTGFTLLEVLVAVAILAIVLASLLSSQMDAMRATRYARDVSAAAYLAEHQLFEIEWELKRDGWGIDDQEFRGNFSDEGWPEIRYTCLVDVVELPDYSALQAASNAADSGGRGTGVNVQDVGEQAFSMMALVWPIIKEAVEQAIRKTSCTVVWKDGKIEHDFTTMTFWTDVSKLNQLPSLGGESSEDDGREGEEDPREGTRPGGTVPGRDREKTGSAPMKAGGR